MTKTKEPVSIDWNNTYNFGKKSPNPLILKKYGDRVWNRDDYAEKFYLEAIKRKIVNKEVTQGQTLKIIGIRKVRGTDIDIILDGMIDAVIELEREKDYLKSMESSPESFAAYLNSEEGHLTFIAEEPIAKIESVEPYVKASIKEGQVSKMMDEFRKQLHNPTIAYEATITGKNNGGYIININGITGFLPGSLAATNIVRDFDSMIDKTLYVMVEDYLKESNTFVFSYKKYVNIITPLKMENLNTTDLYTGTITGTSKYGIFIEFDEIFTGLLHYTKMTPEMKKLWENGFYKSGDEISFWIREITIDKKLILTDENPLIRVQEIEDFKLKNLGKIVKDGEVISIKSFGTLVKLPNVPNDFIGLISNKDAKNKKFEIGEKVSVSVNKIYNDKIMLGLS